ncbi:MAG: hypothetical protein ACJ761_01860 [Chloroflexota bacterium]
MSASTRTAQTGFGATKWAAPLIGTALAILIGIVIAVALVSGPLAASKSVAAPGLAPTTFDKGSRGEVGVEDPAIVTAPTNFDHGGRVVVGAELPKVAPLPRNLDRDSRADATSAAKSLGGSHFRTPR